MAVESKRSALIIASDDYADPGLKRLRAPASDARALATVLRDPGIGDFEVRTLLNEPAHEVNLAVEEFFADRQPDDLLLLHFSCHGIKDEDGELYFATADTRLRRLGATAVAAEFVNRRMSRSRSRRVVLLLDCCYAGAFEHGMTARAGEGVGIGAQFGGRGRAVITASSAMEYAFEGDQLADTRALAPSVFTSALVEGLETGDADRDQDGHVALDELYDYVYDRVRTVTPNQTPGKWTFGVQGELVIARRARPVTTPAPLPPELQEAIDSPLASVRGAVVQELAHVMHGTHAGRALAARLALERLTEDDSRTTAAAAAEVLGSFQEPPAPPRLEPPAPPRLELSATAVDFGRIAYGAKSPDRRIRLRNAGGGSLNARTASEADWLRLRLEGDEVILTVEHSAGGQARIHSRRQQRRRLRQHTCAGIRRARETVGQACRHLAGTIAPGADCARRAATDRPIHRFTGAAGYSTGASPTINADDAGRRGWPRCPARTAARLDCHRRSWCGRGRRRYQLSAPRRRPQGPITGTSATRLATPVHATVR